jgi:hypothetical protein
MRRILRGALIALLIVGFGLVCGVHTPANASNLAPGCRAESCLDRNNLHAEAPAYLSRLFWWSPYACGIESPAYTFYSNARALPCPVKSNPPVNPKGSN